MHFILLIVIMASNSTTSTTSPTTEQIGPFMTNDACVATGDLLQRTYAASLERLDANGTRVDHRPMFTSCLRVDS